MGSYTFLGEKFKDFSRIFQDPTLVYMNLPSKMFALKAMCTCRNARQGELKNACKPDIHCALVVQWTCAKETREQWEKHECFHTFCKSFENFIFCIPEHLFSFTVKLISVDIFGFFYHSKANV